MNTLVRHLTRNLIGGRGEDWVGDGQIVAGSGYCDSAFERIVFVLISSSRFRVHLGIGTERFVRGKARQGLK